MATVYKLFELDGRNFFKALYHNFIEMRKRSLHGFYPASALYPRSGHALTSIVGPGIGMQMQAIMSRGVSISVATPTATATFLLAGRRGELIVANFLEGKHRRMASSDQKG
jgi:hypothetical protein